MATQTRAELSQQLGAIRSAAQARLAEVRRAAQAAERAQVPVYGQPVKDFEAGKSRAESAARHAEDVADDWLIDARRSMKATQDQLDGPSGWGLSPSEWQAAGNLGGVAGSVMVDGPLGGALAELRSAIRAGDRPRAAAFAMAAETRLRSREQALPAGEGRVASVRAQDEQELRSMIADARALCRDSSLDGVRQEFRETVGAVSALGAAVYKARAARKPFETHDGKPKVRWPVKGDNGRPVHPETGEEWQAWSDRTEAEKRDQFLADLHFGDARARAGG